MKRITTALLLSLPFTFLWGQAEEARLLSHWADETIPATSWLNSRYNEVWGLTQNGLEIAVIGSTMGVHFIDVTDPENPNELKSAFVQGNATGANLVHRDYHDYGGYLYTVADEGFSTLQIIDLSNLPDTAMLVYNSDELLRRSHNIFIDSTSARLYACGVSAQGGNPSLRILSLDDPVNPTILASYPNGTLSLPYVHDCYVRHDTAYLNCGNSGFFVVDFTDPLNPNLLGTMTTYPQEGYNHSGWLHETLPIYYLADETHGMDLKAVDVSDFADIKVVSTFDTGSEIPTSIPHNLIVRDNYLYVSYYYEGLQVYDLTDPANPVRVAYYDTYPGEDEDFYAGAWGVYPFLPSGNILISDMQGGLFVIESMESLFTGARETAAFTGDLRLFPQPASGLVNISIELETALHDAHLQVLDLNGRVLRQQSLGDLNAGRHGFEWTIPGQWADGYYLLQLQSREQAVTKKLVLQR
ncbi:MAG: choice-of-anchor B family protein [Saprospiraceae bacterium]|nr:choice-of-anchor B family protein [Saprospiraceae bacterium]MCB0625633.1 choice-of-anchor B family protein [Saprospiraceae bacterium]MCB0681516.1 choice-of-anchor B family protein [Saprospiraceae bacterium]